MKVNQITILYQINLPLMSGYSGTPLAKKLGLKEGHRALVLGAPKHYWSLFEELPVDLTIHTRMGKGPYDFIHFFCQKEKDFLKRVGDLRERLKKDGGLWVSWPKGSSSLATDLKRDFIREYILQRVGLVDCKVAAVDEDWSGLKFMYRKTDR